jgi:protein-disulfide isomerase
VQYPRQRGARRQRSTLTRRQLILASLAVAAAAVAALIGASLLSGGDEGAGSGGSIHGGAESAALFAGVPQNGNVLGSPQAPLTLIEYGDLQCPYCGDFARDTLPALVREYVRPGTLRIEFRGMAFVGPDSDTALRAVVAAGGQHRLWEFAHLLYVNQGIENSGWVTESFLRDAARAVPPLDPHLLLERAESAQVTGEIGMLQQQARADAIESTPSFLLGRTGGEMQPLVVESLHADTFRAALDDRLR